VPIPTRPTDRRAPSWVGPAAVVGTFVALAWLERRRPLRPGRHEPKGRREARNAAVAGLAATMVRLAEKPVTDRLTALVEHRRIGLLPRLGLPPAAETAAACLLLDYTLYVWHVLTHKVPVLWRFHRVHHADLDLDASTAVRFHFGEMLWSVAWRATQVLVIGVPRRALDLWGTLLLVEVMFHHSNLELPPAVERVLRVLLVTPRMHGIHHSVVRAETDSNWSSGLTVWDWLHGTLQTDVPQADVTIGVPELRRPDQVTLPKLIALPFAAGQMPQLEPPRASRA
jgi:sterol desaturase/sphingolipid hydroxylase (fatty acid hydroxylase superfamily)